ncbi:MAG: hypothetical protein HKN43_17260 [Rhodothermales bacterium]|nr:hypothetical protein [Rhodothermales bacterium]
MRYTQRTITFGYTATFVLFVGWCASSVWLFVSLDPSDWVPIVVSGLGLLIALAVAVWSGSEQRRLAQMTFAVTLWGQWSEESMLQARNTAWDALDSLPFSDGYKRVGLLRDQGSEGEQVYRSLARVNHFLADLNDFLTARLLHLDDVNALFRDTLQAYYCHLLFVDLEKGMEDRRGNEHQIWFTTKVLGLADHLKLRRAADYKRYGSTLSGNEELARQSVSQQT